MDILNYIKDGKLTKIGFKAYKNLYKNTSN